jgi:hypothetical protein
MCCNVRKCKVKSTSPKLGVKVIEFYLLCFVVPLMLFELRQSSSLGVNLFFLVFLATLILFLVC